MSFCHGVCAVSFLLTFRSQHLAGPGPWGKVIFWFTVTIILGVIIITNSRRIKVFHFDIPNFGSSQTIQPLLFLFLPLSFARQQQEEQQGEETRPTMAAPSEYQPLNTPGGLFGGGMGGFGNYPFFRLGVGIHAAEISRPSARLVAPIAGRRAGGRWELCGIIQRRRYLMEHFGLISAVILACPPRSIYPTWTGIIFFSSSNIGRIFAVRRTSRHSPTPLDRLRRKQMNTAADK